VQKHSVKRNWSSYHFLTIFAQSYLANTRVATEEFYTVSQKKTHQL